MVLRVSAADVILSEGRSPQPKDLRTEYLLSGINTA